MLQIEKKCTFADVFVRGVAQLVARYVRDVEAASSSLVTPTNLKKKKMTYNTLILIHIVVALIG